MDLRSLFLFEALTDDQLDWVQAHFERLDVPAGGRFFAEGDPATCFYVLVSGTIRLSKTVRGDEVEVTRSDQPGAYCGSTQSYIADVEPTYRNSGTAVTDVTVLQLPAREWGQVLREWFPLPMHLLEGMFLGMQNVQSVVGQRERLLALGSLSAGLTHELNNPAAAALRATGALRERVAGMRHKLALIAGGNLEPATVRQLVELQEEAVARVATAPRLSALELSDAEDVLSDWLDDHAITGGWDLAPVLVAGGLDAEWLDKVSRTTPPGLLEGAVRWLAYAVETETLMNEVTDSTNRISALVASARQYSQLDRAPYQTVDLHELIDSTLVMLGRKIGDVRVVKEYDPALPPVPAYAAELNQVWTNVVDNALWAMGGAGTLTIGTAVDGPSALVTITDTGPGIPADVVPRIFEPFFTTKPVGDGTGLGLDISWRIVVKKHRGDLRVHSTPGDTRFEIRLPLTPTEDVA